MISKFTTALLFGAAYAGKVTLYDDDSADVQVDVWASGMDIYMKGCMTDKLYEDEGEGEAGAKNELTQSFDIRNDFVFEGEGEETLQSADWSTGVSFSYVPAQEEGEEAAKNFSGDADWVDVPENWDVNGQGSKWSGCAKRPLMVEGWEELKTGTSYIVTGSYSMKYPSGLFGGSVSNSESAWKRVTLTEGAVSGLATASAAIIASLLI